MNVPSEVLISKLAAAGLSDDDYVAAVATIRQLAAIAAAGRTLADAVMDALSYQPPAVVAALSVFDAQDPGRVQAAAA